ncbi:MAG TPA: nucleotidyltransferase domain-containing protein [Thermoanaerobacterium sp.]|nr:nucleotidyltransferase domain-containing protein [Thermoanaerobacterium sp.]
MSIVVHFIIFSIKFIGEKYNDIDKMVIYGSRSRGDNRKTSDIDIAVYCKDGSHKGAIYCDLDDINTLLKLDIVFIDDNTDKKLLDNTGMVLLYEENNNKL